MNEEDNKKRENQQTNKENKRVENITRQMSLIQSKCVVVCSITFH
jgi:hypothetical protein